jgi:hypothetical protein
MTATQFFYEIQLLLLLLRLLLRLLLETDNFKGRVAACIGHRSQTLCQLCKSRLCQLCKTTPDPGWNLRQKVRVTLKMHWIEQLFKVLMKLRPHPLALPRHPH